MHRRTTRIAGPGNPALRSVASVAPPMRPPARTATVAIQLRLLGIGLLAIALLFGVAPLAQPGARAAALRVAIIVGPVGSLTASYRADAEKAAAEARRYTDDVVTVYSPDATWSAAKTAMSGASIVVYLGHGNGFPSRYSRTLNPRSQDGLGLNPLAGADDAAHQYFGESYLASSVRLAPNAVVVLSHLCYASGNSEPGLPEGSLEVAIQRVDNFAAGFLAAGAAAVIADGHMGPAYYIRSILAAKGTVEGIWRSAPNFHDHVTAFPSVRTPGFGALLDPTNRRSGFYRSLVTRAELRADEVARGAALGDDVVRPDAGAGASAEPPRIGPTVARASLSGVPTAGSQVRLTLVLSDPGSESPAGLQVGVRWSPLDTTSAEPSAPAASAVPKPEGSPTAQGSPTPTPAASAAPTPAGSPTADGSPPPEGSRTSDPGASPGPTLEPARGLVASEVPGDVVMLAEVRATAKSVRADVDVPDTPGLYRLVTTIHDAQGVAFDAATQDRIPALLVRVTGTVSARLATTDQLVVTTGDSVEVPVAVMNSGTVAWAESRSIGRAADGGDTGEPASPPALLVGHWVRLDPAGGGPDLGTVWARLAVAPGATEQVSLYLIAPDLPGDYLLLLDVVSPSQGSLVAAGNEPVSVRVTVGWPVAEPGGKPRSRDRADGTTADAANAAEARRARGSPRAVIPRGDAGSPPVRRRLRRPSPGVGCREWVAGAAEIPA